MPPLNTHLVIAERVFTQLEQFDASEYGAFLAGNLIVDVNAFTAIDRRTTHFVGRFNEDGEASFTQSCANFFAQHRRLLQRPWSALNLEERAFVAGYLCHLAADESWKAMVFRLPQMLKIDSIWTLPVPGTVILTTFSVLSHALYADFDAVGDVLMSAAVPDVFTHVAYTDFLTMWEAIKLPLLKGDSPESFFEMLTRNGKSPDEVQEVREQHARHWTAAVAVIDQMGGVEKPVAQAVDHVLDTFPALERTFGSVEVVGM